MNISVLLTDPGLRDTAIRYIARADAVNNPVEQWNLLWWAIRLHFLLAGAVVSQAVWASTWF